MVSLDPLTTFTYTYVYSEKTSVNLRTQSQVSSIIIHG